MSNYLTESAKLEREVSRHTGDPDVFHLASHGGHHAFTGSPSDRDTHTYHVHDGQHVHTVELEHGGQGRVSSKHAIKKQLPGHIHPKIIDSIHKDHKEEMKMMGGHAPKPAPRAEPGNKHWAAAVKRAKANKIAKKNPDVFWDSHPNVAGRHLAQLSRDAGYKPTQSMLNHEKLHEGFSLVDAAVAAMDSGEDLKHARMSQLTEASGSPYAKLAHHIEKDLQSGELNWLGAKGKKEWAAHAQNLKSNDPKRHKRVAEMIGGSSAHSDEMEDRLVQHVEKSHARKFAKHGGWVHTR